MGPLDSEIIEQLSMSVVNPITALLMITSFVELKEGDWLVQSAANSAVGGYVIQLARQRGIKTVNIVRRDGLTDDLIAKGADVVLVDGSDLAAKIASATNDASIALALDPDAIKKTHEIAKSLNEYGVLVKILNVPEGADVGDLNIETVKELMKVSAVWHFEDRLRNMIGSLQSGSLI